MQIKAWVDAINYIREHSEYREKDCAQAMKDADCILGKTEEKL